MDMLSKAVKAGMQIHIIYRRNPSIYSKRRNNSMIKNNVAVVGAGLGGCKVGYGFQQRNYNTYLINGSLQDNRVISGAKICWFYPGMMV